MKFIATFLYLFLLSFSAFSQHGKIAAVPDSSKEIMQAEVSCGQCKFGLAGKGCSLAVRMGDKAYYVDGTSIDEHGDAHAADGFCNAIRKAAVQGVIINNRFKATYFKLLE